MFTTAGALGILLFAEFKAFREFGMISAVGVLICFVCALLLVPALDVLMPGREQGPGTRPTSEASARPSSVSRARIFALLAIAGLAAYGGPKVEFEKDLRQLTVPKSKKGGISYGSATGRCSKSTVLVAENPEALNEVVQAFEADREVGHKLVGGAPMTPPKTEADRKPYVRSVYALATLLPEEEPQKAQLLVEIARQANDALAELDPKDPEDDELRTHLEALEMLAQSSPMNTSILPRWAREPFVERDGTEGRLAHLCLRMNSKHLDDLVVATQRIDEVIGEAAVLRADSRLVFADLISSMRRDAQRLPGWALAVIFALIALDLRALRPTLACFGSLALGLGLTLGVMGLWPLHLNFFNLVVMPAVIGLSIDASIHLWHARGRASAGATGQASLIAAMTTIAGFGGLLIARHPGLRSIGELGVASVALCVGVAFLALYQRGSDPADDS
jgi:predicted exporter